MFAAIRPQDMASSKVGHTSTAVTFTTGDPAGMDELMKAAA